MERHPTKRSRKGMKSTSAILTVNKKYGRIYFSAFAVDHLLLINASVTFTFTDSRWHIIVGRKWQGLSLTAHQGSFYIVDKTLVGKLCATHDEERISYKILGYDVQFDRYPIEYVSSQPAVRRRPKPSPLRHYEEKSHISSAERKVTLYELDDFRGRIKTQEVLRAEKFLRTRRRR
jgi:hypothetical protein